MGMGVHIKVVLRFREADVFRAQCIPQLNSADPRFQFYNLHAHGKARCIRAHVLAESGFASNYQGLDDEEVVEEVLCVLHRMFHSSGAVKPLAGGKLN